jgi:hypothetical protein
MIRQFLLNLNILLKFSDYDETIISKFKYFIKLNYYEITMLVKFKYFIKIL